MPRRRERGFIWIPRDKSTKYTIYIDSVDVTDDVIESEWARAIIGLECPCKLTLIDANGDYAALYTGGETVELLLDFSDGTTSQWKGTLEQPNKQMGNTYTLELIGSHYQSDLLDITVTASYDGTKTADEVYKELVDEYLTGHTYTGVLPSTTLITKNWDNKPLWDCILDLCNLAKYDARVDSDKDHSFFTRESIVNETDAIVWNDTMISLKGLGPDTVDVKNRIIVYGEDDTGLPIVYIANDTTSQATHGIKEKVIKDTSINTYEEAKELGDAELLEQKNTSQKGEAESIILPDINPGEMVYVIDPVQHVHDTFRIVKYTHKLPMEFTDVIIAKDKTIPTIFKERTKKEGQLQKITNPYKMTNSYNFTFDDGSNIDTTVSGDVDVIGGSLYLLPGNSTGNMISTLRNHSTDINYVQAKVIGDALAGTIYYASTDNGETYKQITLEEDIAVEPGTQLRVKIELNSTDTRVHSFALLYRS